ncbi:hypothetical protein ACHAQH_007818, partial [Verticillium albo-atrum]
IISIGRKSATVHGTASYLLFSHPDNLQRWGFLYVPFRATAYYYILPFILHLVIKTAVIAFGQRNITVQVIGLIIVEAAALGSASILRPWMDKKTNVPNVVIHAINLVNAVLLFLLTGDPPLMVGIAGILIFLVNAIFSLILLLFIIGSSIVVFCSKNPDNRYRAMGDDRVSFWKSKTQLDLSQELDALAATARRKDSVENSGYEKAPISTPEENGGIDITARSAASRSQPALHQRDDVSKYGHQ